ncbi:MAG: carbon storage regulator CsrA [Proteobacteria bacterium]|nr:carbon storage regulator CsrA [Pseudomonadota bacterium]MBU1581172.1 carbon storage regulator CsrA [Pseudomonadota bacterium]MBU2454585.1 carbon storage regulator CsrA [Pseudomonadota bacterium]MBU2628390.1 carbon storage regulator CsrA [Pseudomonadota bacterium]
MLILTRKIGESIVIGDDIVIKVVETGKNSIRIGIDAPKEITVLRLEVFESIQRENILSSKGDKSDITKAAKLFESKEPGKKE